MGITCAHGGCAAKPASELQGQRAAKPASRAAAALPASRSSRPVAAMQKQRHSKRPGGRGEAGGRAGLERGSGRNAHQKEYRGGQHGRGPVHPLPMSIRDPASGEGRQALVPPKECGAPFGIAVPASPPGLGRAELSQLRRAAVHTSECGCGACAALLAASPDRGPS